MISRVDTRITCSNPTISSFQLVKKLSEYRIAFDIGHRFNRTAEIHSVIRSFSAGVGGWHNRGFEKHNPSLQPLIFTPLSPVLLLPTKSLIIPDVISLPAHVTYTNTYITQLPPRNRLSVQSLQLLVYSHLTIFSTNLTRRFLSPFPHSNLQSRI
jgi:hypothetical protein